METAESPPQLIAPVVVAASVGAANISTSWSQLKLMARNHEPLPGLLAHAKRIYGYVSSCGYCCGLEAL